MKKTIKVTVIFPQTFQIEVDTSDDIGTIIKQVKDHALSLNDASDASDAIITKSEDMEELEE